jgi:hypothetical protein
MGFAPYRIPHLAQAAQFLGKGKVQHIDQPGEVLPESAYLIAGATS